MTTTEIALVQDSFELLVPNAQDVAASFYARLFELAPQVRPLFKEDLHEQGIKLIEMLSYAVSSLDDLEGLVPALEDLARRHLRYGVRAEHYGLVAQALLDTLTRELGEAFGEAEKAAWTKVLTTIATVMISAAYGEK